MRIGLITRLLGRPDGDVPAPSWESISERATVAEAAGFDMFEDKFGGGDNPTKGALSITAIPRKAVTNGQSS